MQQTKQKSGDAALCLRIFVCRTGEEKYKKARHASYGHKSGQFWLLIFVFRLGNGTVIQTPIRKKSWESRFREDSVPKISR